MQLSKVVRQEWLLLTVLILVSLSSQIIFIVPVTLSDQMVYYHTAVNFPRLPQNPSHWSMRLGVVLPVAVIYRIFGHSEFTYYFLPISSTILLVASTYLIGRMLFNRVVGAAAALWLSFLPYFLLESGNLLPDITASACVTTAIMLLLAIRDEPNGKSQRWIYLLSGALFGWGYLAKEYFAVFAVIIPLIFWLFKIPGKRLAWIAAGISLMVAIEFGIHAVSYGNPLLRLTTSQPRETIGYIERDVLHIIGLFFIRLSRYRGLFSILIAASGLTYLIIQSIQRSKIHLVLLIWFLMVYIFFTVLGLLPVLLNWEDTVLLRLHVFRYWIPLLPPLAIASAAALNCLIRRVVKPFTPHNRSIRSFTGLLLALVFIAAGINNILAVWSSPKFTRTESGHYLELRAYLRENVQADREMWIVRDLKIGYEYVLPIYAHTPFGKENWRGTIKYLNTDGLFLRADEITTGSVLVDRVHFNPAAYPIPVYLADIPENWRLAFQSRNGRIAIYDVR